MLTWHKPENRTAPKFLKLGEIFEYEVLSFNEDEKKEVEDTWRCFFVKVDGNYYLINLEEKEYCFFPDGIKNFPYNGNPRKGSDPFSYGETLQFLKSRNARPTGKMAYTKKRGEKEKTPDSLYDGFRNYSSYAYTFTNPSQTVDDIF